MACTDFYDIISTCRDNIVLSVVEHPGQEEVVRNSVIYKISPERSRHGSNRAV